MSEQNIPPLQIAPEGGLRTQAEALIPQRISQAFDRNPASTSEKLEHFPKYIRRQKVTRFLALYELFKLVLPVKGSIVECGVHQGFSFFSWAHFSAILEPNNIMRRIYGFDTFGGFASTSAQDMSSRYSPKAGDLSACSYDELLDLTRISDENRFLGHVDKSYLVRGDVKSSIPAFLEQNKHLLVSLLFLDLDIYEATKIAIESFVPRMPKGAVIAFDELDNPIWPGETLAMLETLGAGRLELRRFEFDPYIAYAIL